MKLIKIVDTREYEIIDGIYGGERKVYFPGTGIKNVCAMCGKEHEIHAYIEDDAGAMSIVGIGCARKIAGMKGQIKIIELSERLESVKFPGTWKITREMSSTGKYRFDEYGRRIYKVTINGNDYTIHTKSEKDALLVAAHNIPDYANIQAWKSAISEYYRIKRIIAKYQE